MSGTMMTIAILFCLVTAGVLAIGIIGFGSGKASGSTSNKLMRFRILFQFVAICFILGAVFFAQNGS
ncbi:MAG: twin transmembrane helix small protein [Pseudomonadota bacterium]